MGEKVSIVITCYNKRGYIGAMLDSVIAQLWDDIEVIIVDDGSTDGSKEVIADYMPKLQQRGFDVILIEQENSGVSGAVKSGLQKITGDFVCVLDGDDFLHEEYVSALATTLISNPNIDWVSCDFSDMPYDMTGSEFLKNNNTFDLNNLQPETWLDAWLLRRIILCTNTTATTTAYLKRCRIVENIATVPRYDHEPQIMLPIMLSGGTGFHLRRGLYNYNRFTVTDSIIHQNTRSVNRAKEFIDLYVEASRKTLKKHDALTPRNSKLLEVLKLNWLFQKIQSLDEQSLISRLLNLKLTNTDIPVNIAQNAGFSVLCHFIMNAIINVEFININIKRQLNGRIIAYGAFGRAAVQVRTGLHHSDIKPDEYWDRAAKTGDEILGIPVLLPNFSVINENDIILILLKTTMAAQKVTELKESLSTKGRIVYYYDTIDYLINYYFGEL